MDPANHPFKAFMHEFKQWCSDELCRAPETRQRVFSALTASEYRDSFIAMLESPESILPPLPEIWNQQVSKALADPGAVTVVGRATLGKEMLGLRPNRFINDEIIDTYISVLKKSRGINNICHPWDLNRKPANNSNKPRFNPREQSQIFIPINHEVESHWTFVRILPLTSASEILVEHYDSYKALGVKIPSTLGAWLSHYFPGIPWRMSVCFSPQQDQHPESGTMNACGTFMLMGIRMMYFGAMHLSQPAAIKTMPLFRRRVLAEILAGTLDPSDLDHQAFTQAQQENKKRLEADALWKVKDSSPKLLPVSVSFPPAAAIKQLDLNHQPSPATEEPALESDELFVPDNVSFGVPVHGTQIQDSKVSENDSSSDNTSVESIISKPHKDTATAARESLADQELLIRNLQSAISAVRARHITPDQETLATLCTRMNVNETSSAGNLLFGRHDREKFSRMFHDELHALGWEEGDRATKHQKYSMIEKLGCRETEYRQIQALASRTYVWTILVRRVREIIGDRAPVILCAINVSTSAVEGMRKEGCSTFIEHVISKLKDPKSKARATLEAASDLYIAVTTGVLPPYTLRLERGTPLSLGFEKAVSLDL